MRVKYLKLKNVKNFFIDFYFGGSLKGTKETPYDHLGAYGTVNTDYDALSILFDQRISKTDVLVDVGCGKGRVINWWLLNFPKNKIYGIELDPEIAVKTEKRLNKFPTVSILCGDARLLVPADGTVYYLFNPFNAGILLDFIETLKKIAKNSIIKLIYYNPVHLKEIENDKYLTITNIEMPPQFLTGVFVEIKTNTAL